MEGWGHSFGGLAGDAGPNGPLQTMTNPLSCCPIRNGTKRRMLTQLLCLFFSQPKLIPLGLTGRITVELELGDFQDCFGVNVDGEQIGWQMIQPELLCDTITVDPSLSSSYASSLLQGRSLSLSWHNLSSFK